MIVLHKLLNIISQMEQNQLDNHYLHELSKPNPIQQKTLTEPRSIQPLFPLPHFQYSNQPSQLVNYPKQSEKGVHLLKQPVLSAIFAQPLYQANTKYKPNSNNLCFACLKAFYSQSGVHPSPLQIINDNQQVQFQSRFESGNLAYAVKSQNNNEYYLLLQKDINTTRCTQWFFFRIKNKKYTGKLKFHILNFLKGYSSFQNGMKVSICSKSNNYTWLKGCEEINYIKNNIKVKGQQTYYTLSFTHDFTVQNDETYFAHSIPYTFSMLDSYLLNISNNISYQAICKRKTLTETPGGNYVDMLTITNFISKKQKRVVVLTSRVHPGQTPSSFVIEGIITYLLSNHEDAKRLRQNFIFKIIPMLNPDGVINGSYRCSLSGYDLNRVWHYPNKLSSPQIYHTKKSILQLNNCFLFVDLHAHSKKKGVFMYGCQNRISPYLSRHFPYLLWKQMQYFNYYQCNFGMKRGRQGTARLTFHNIFNLPYSYTMQYSFCSPVKQKIHFMPNHYQQMGKQFCTTLKKYFCIKQQNALIFTDLYSNKQLLKVGSGEDASSSDDSQLDQPLQYKQLLEHKNYYSRKQSSNLNYKIMDIFPSSSIKLQPKRSIKIIQQKRAQKIYSSLPQKRRAQNFMTRKLINHLPSELSQIQTSLIEMRGEEVFLSARIKQQSIKINQKPQFQQTNFKMARYNFQQAQNLSNLFLPSLTSASYKKYTKKKPNSKLFYQNQKKNLWQKGLLKQQIKSYSNCKKKTNLKDEIQSHL